MPPPLPARALTVSSSATEVEIELDASSVQQVSGHEFTRAVMAAIHNFLLPQAGAQLSRQALKTPDLSTLLNRFSSTIGNWICRRRETRVAQSGLLQERN